MTATDLGDRVLGEYTLREFSGRPEQETGDPGLARTDDGGKASLQSTVRSGRRWADAWRTKYTALGFVFVKLHQRKN